MNAPRFTRMLAPLVMLSVAVPATAGVDQDRDIATAPIVRSDLNLDRPADQALLHRRIQLKANALCASLHRQSVATRQDTHRSCVIDAVSRTVAAVHNAGLAALHSQWLAGEPASPAAVPAPDSTADRAGSRVAKRL